MFNIRFVSSIANFKRSLPNLERCDRPNDAVGKFDIEYPGCFLHGPDENSGFAGFGPGAAALIQRAVNAREAMAEVEPAVRCEEKARARAAGANRSMFTIL